MNALVAESQIAESMNLGLRAVRNRAENENWSAVKKKKQGGNELFYLRDLLPPKVQEKLVVREAATGNPGLPALITETKVPKRSQKIGMAKYNLVHAYRLAKTQAPWGEKGKAAKAFLLSYNSGVLLPQVLEEIGEIQKKTIEALDKKLRKNDDNYLVLCDGRGGWKKHGTNKYKKRILSEAAKTILLKCYLHGSRPTVSMAIYATRTTLKKMGIPETAEDSTFRRWLKDYERYNAGVICLARDGQKAYQDHYGPYITRDASLLKVGQCLVADGKVLNFTILHPDTGRPCRMILLVFFDWASRYPVGWQIMPTENQVSILAAFRNAVETLGRYPDSVYLDNGRAFKSKLFTETNPDFEEMRGLYARVGTATMFAKPYNGRSKVVERFFLTIQSQLEFMMPSYCGDSIDTKPAWMHRNEKWHKAWHQNQTQNWIPNLREAALIIGQYFEWYSRQPHSDLPAPPADILLPNRGPGVDLLQLNHDFLMRKEVKPRNCRIRLWGIDYESDCLLNLSRKEPVLAMVDTANLDTTWCYTKDGVYLGEARPVQACHPLAQLFGDQVSLDQVQAANKRQAKLAKQTRQHLNDMGITKDAQDSLNVLPFTGQKMKTAILTQGSKAPAANEVKQVQEQIPEKEIKRLEQLVEKAVAEQETLPEIARPRIWGSDLEHYDWCFELINRHGRDLDPDDQAFMTNFETLPEFENYRERYEDLKLIL